MSDLPQTTSLNATGNEESMVQKLARETGQLLTCRIASQWVAIPVQQVSEVMAPSSVTPIPLAPQVVDGLINLRGKVITQLDVRTIFALTEARAKGFRVAILESASGESFGLVIDEVGAVISLHATAYEKTPRNLGEAWIRISDGVLKVEGHVVVLIDVERLIALTLEANAVEAPA